MSKDEIRATTAAKRLGISGQSVSMLKKRGRLSGRHGYVTVESLEQYISTMKRPRSEGKYIRPAKYTKDEMKALGKAKTSDWSNKLMNHHYIL
jgi:hypothetical protein